MNEPSAFQRSHPLSPKKFTKKMIAFFPRALVYSLFLGVGISAIYLLVVMASDTSRFVNHDELAIKTIIAGMVVPFVVLLVVLNLLYAWYIKAYIKRYYYDLSDQFITIKKGVFSPAEIHVQYQRIQDVYVDQDILDRLLGMYDVHIASATMSSAMEAHIDGVDERVAELIKTELLGCIQGRPYSTQNIAAASTPVSNQTNVTQSAQKVRFNSEYSSATFPISERWYTYIVVQTIWVAAMYVFFLVLFFGRYFSSSDSMYSGDNTKKFFAVLLGVYALIFVGRLAWYKLWQKQFYFSFNPEYILLHTGVVSREERHVPYMRVQDVRFEQSFLERIFGISNVVIENAASGSFDFRNRKLQQNGITIPGQTTEKANQIVEALKNVLVNTQNAGL